MKQNNRPLGWTTLEESKQLVEAGLPVETADMYYWLAEEREYVYTGKCSDPNGIPCWSLGVLMQLLPLSIEEVKDHSVNLVITPSYKKDLWCVFYFDDTGLQHEPCIYDKELRTAIVNMTLLLLNKKLL